MSGEFLTITLGAAGSATATQQFQKAGRYFEITADGGSTVNLTFYGSNGAIQSNVNNAQSGLYLNDPWGAFSVTNNSTAAQTLTFLLMDNGNGGSRRQPGTVRVIDSSADKTQMAKQYLGGNANPANGAGSASLVTVQANGKTVAVKRIIITSPTGGDILIASATSQGTAMVGALAGLTNKLIGGALSTARCSAAALAGTNPTAGEVPGYAQFLRLTTTAAVPFVLDVSASPYVISGTQALVVLDGSGGNRQIGAYFDIEELT